MRALFLALFLAACGDTPGQSLDAAAPADAGAPRPDADLPRGDGGKLELDASFGPDAGPSTDAEPLHDGGGAPERLVAFASRRSGNYDLYVMPFPRGPARAVTDGPAGDFYPDWTPDGRALVFARLAAGAISLYRVEVATASTTPIVLTDVVHATAPSVSPDGTRVAFEGRRALSDSAEIFVAPISGGAATRLTQNAHADASPMWSASGERIFFTSNESGAFELYSMAPDGTGRALLTNGSRLLDRPTVDPNGQRLAFARSGAGNSTELVFFDLSSRAPTAVPRSVDGDGEPRFSRDGRYLLFSSARFGNPEVGAFDLMAGGAPIQVTMDPAIDGQPALQP